MNGSDPAAGTVLLIGTAMGVSAGITWAFFMLLRSDLRQIQRDLMEKHLGLVERVSRLEGNRGNRRSP